MSKYKIGDLVRLKSSSCLFFRVLFINTAECSVGKQINYKGRLLANKDYAKEGEINLRHILAGQLLMYDLLECELGEIVDESKEGED